MEAAQRTRKPLCILRILCASVVNLFFLLLLKLTNYWESSPALVIDP
jgi:hypothetical protein